ncbi:MAG: type II toxin-antitoxin system VapC family toxin [Verrucomicrobiota bacterium]
MNVLVDTNVWVGFFRYGNPLLESLLEDGEVASHPIVIGELAMGNLPKRRKFLSDLMKLERPKTVSWNEIFHMVEDRNLWGRGIQWNDAAILASAILSNLPLWTLDKRLAAAAREAGVAWNG